MVKSYEELAGAVGRAQQFRRRRYDAAELFSGAPPALYFDDRLFELKNISGSGSGAAAPAAEEDSALSEINRIGVLRLVQGGRELFLGAARVARIEFRGGKIFSGFALEDAQFDITELKKRNASALASQAPRTAASVTPEYKAFCADVINFVADYLDRIERTIAPIEATMSTAESDAFARALCDSAAPGWRDIVTKGNDLVIPSQRVKSERMAIKTYTERVLTRMLLGGEGWRRTYFKPMGYPGDFRIMNYIYDGDPVGDDVKSKFLHLLSLVGAEPVRTRMRRLAELVVAETANTPADEPVGVLSIGAGPAREAQDILTLSAPDRHWRFTLLDQEEEALEFASGGIAGLGAGDRMGVSAFNASFKEMLDPTPAAALAEQNSVIYSAGLVDYLNPLVARRFVKRLYELLKPGGSIIIGNVNDKATGMIWPSEYVVDWSLFFRSRDEMLDMASGVPEADVSIETDSLDAIYFLIVRKPR
ncbi:MAG: hypothetical protein AB7F91_08655 [Parvularculaceae bacterium]